MYCWTKNTRKPNFWKTEKIHPKCKNSKPSRNMPKISVTAFDQRSVIHREAWFPGGPRIPKNPFFFEKWKKPSKKQKLKNVWRYAKISDTPFDQRSLIHREAWFPPCFVRQNECGNFRQLSNKNVQIWDHFFPLLFPKDSKSLKILDIQLWEMGAKRHLNGTSKVNTQTDGQTDRRTNRQTDILTYRKHRPRGPML